MARILVDKNSHVEPGATYELVIKVKGKYDKKHIDNLISLVRGGEGLVKSAMKAPEAAYNNANNMWEIQDVIAESDIWKGYVPIVNNGPSEEWRLRIIAKKTDSGTPVFVAVGVILALIIILVGVVGWQAYRIKDAVGGLDVFIVGAVLITAIVFLPKIRSAA